MKQAYFPINRAIKKISDKNAYQTWEKKGYL